MKMPQIEENIVSTYFVNTKGKIYSPNIHVVGEKSPTLHILILLEYGLFTRTVGNHLVLVHRYTYSIVTFKLVVLNMIISIVIFSGVLFSCACKDNNRVSNESV